MTMIRTLSAMVILLLLLSALSVPATAAGGSGGADGAGAGAQGNSDNSAGDGAAPSEGPQAQPLQEEQERKQQTTVEQPGVQINQQDRDQTQGRTNVSTDDETIILQRDREHFLQQVGMRQQNLSGEPERAQVHTALYALSIAGNVTGRDGPELARLGAEMNTSFAAAYAAEEQIKNQNSLMRMLYGGDREAAGLLVQYADQNRQRIQTMEQLIANCSDCDPQVRLMLEEQVQVLSQEQNRLITLGQEEQADKGLFGWLF